jgi:hypothetical protein
MRWAAFRILLAAALASLCCVPGQAEPRKFQSAEGRFAAIFPGWPHIWIEPRTEKSPVRWTFFFTTDDGSQSYQVVFFDLPKGTFDKLSSPQGFFDKMVAGLVMESKWSLLSNHRFAFAAEGFPARELVVDSSEGRVIDRVYLIKDRIYQTMVAGPGGIEKSEVTKDFLDSFQLLPE